jgi:hypothetical protein
MIGGIILFLLGPVKVNAQPQPPRPIKLYSIQSMNFGAFYQGFSGGTVIVYANGTRSTTGDVHLLMLGFSFYPAVFQVDANVGTIVTITNGSDAVLTGSNGGSMILHIGDSNPVSPFITNVSPSGRTSVSVGGILTVGNPGANPVGAYSGSFSVIFNQQ